MDYRASVLVSEVSKAECAYAETVTLAPFTVAMIAEATM